MNALKSNTVTESWNCSEDNGETMEGKAPAEFSCMLDTWYSNKTVRSFLYCGQNKHIKTLSGNKVNKAFCGPSWYGQLCFCPMNQFPNNDTEEGS